MRRRARGRGCGSSPKKPCECNFDAIECSLQPRQDERCEQEVVRCNDLFRSGGGRFFERLVLVVGECQKDFDGGVMITFRCGRKLKGTTSATATSNKFCYAIQHSLTRVPASSMHEWAGNCGIFEAN